MKRTDISDLCLSDGPAVADWRFFAYLPLGSLVLLLRLIIILLFALASFLIPARWRRASFRILRLLLGIVVRRNMALEAAALLTKRRIIVSNHVSMLDAFATLDVGEPILLRGTALRGDSRWTPLSSSWLNGSPALGLSPMKTNGDWRICSEAGGTGKAIAACMCLRR